jgi:hypothetical protein
MITGFNTYVDHEGRVFHVQTEDKGLDNPILESLIYSRGQIVESRRTSYADLTIDGGDPEPEIQARMELQHQAMIREIRNGKFDPEGPKPFGHSIITGRSLDEVVREFLREVDRLDGLTLQWVEEMVLQQGTQQALRLRVAEPGTLRAVANARVDVRLVSTDDPPRVLQTATSDAEGLVEAPIDIPEAPGSDMAIGCRSEVDGHRAEIRQMVHGLPGRRPKD